MLPVTRARLTGAIIATCIFGASIAVMYGVRGTFEAGWFYGSLAGYLVLLPILGYGLGSSSRSKTEDERYKLPTRPQYASIEVPERPEVNIGRAKRSDYRIEDFQRPQRPGETSRPSAAAALAEARLPDHEIPIPTFESEETTEIEEPEPVAPEPSGFSHEGFMLYERTVKGKPVRFFSRSAPIGGRPIFLPDGFRVEWDPTAEKPVLRPIAPPMPPEPSPALRPATTPVEAPPLPKATAPAPKPWVETVEEPSGQPCTYISPLGDFCKQTAVAGESYCSDHVAPDHRETEPELEIRIDRAASRQGNAPRLEPGPSPVVVRKDSAPPAPRTGRPGRSTTTGVVIGLPDNIERFDFAAPYSGKPAKPRSTELVIEKPKTAEPPRLKVAEPKLDVRHDKRVSRISGTVPLETTPTTPVVRKDRGQAPPKPASASKYALEKPVRPATTDLRVDRTLPVVLRDKGQATAAPLKRVASKLDVVTPRNEAPEAKPLKRVATRLDVVTPRNEEVDTKPLKRITSRLNVVTPRNEEVEDPIKRVKTRLDVVVPRSDRDAKPLKRVKTRLDVVVPRSEHEEKALKKVKTSLEVVVPRNETPARPSKATRKNLPTSNTLEVVKDDKRHSSLGLERIALGKGKRAPKTTKAAKRGRAA